VEIYRKIFLEIYKKNILCILFLNNFKPFLNYTTILIRIYRFITVAQISLSVELRTTPFSTV